MKSHLLTCLPVVFSPYQKHLCNNAVISRGVNRSANLLFLSSSSPLLYLFSLFPSHIIFLIPSSSQELRSWEEALARAAEEQREQEEQLRRREQELAEREIDIVERELNIIIHQVYQEKPSVKKRKGHFKKSRLLKLGRDSNCISLPSGG